MGKCDEIIHLETNCKAIKIFALTVKNLTKLEDLFLKVEIRENGNEKSKIKNVEIPKLITGSETIVLMISLNTISNDCNNKILIF